MVQPTAPMPVFGVCRIALAGAMTLSFERGAELLNFGALLAFMGVNAAALRHYYLRAAEKRIAYLLNPLLGFMVCLLLWCALSWHAKWLGAVWRMAGIAYGAYNTRGFCKEPCDVRSSDLGADRARAQGDLPPCLVRDRLRPHFHVSAS